VLQLGHVLCRRHFLREGPGQHELGLEHGAGPFDLAVQGRRHPSLHRVDNPLLHIRDNVPGMALILRSKR
jgi:hypothetical protein